MSESKPAFPSNHPSNSGQTFHTGLSQRAYIATKCCAAMVSSIRCDEDYRRMVNIAQSHGMEKLSQFMASEACKQADALLAELAK